MSKLAARCSLIGLSLALLGGPAAAQAPDPPPPTTQSPSGRVEAPPPADPPTGAAKYAIDKRLMMFQKIRDDAIFPWTDTEPRQLADLPDDQLEERAYDEVIRHARQFTTAELEQHARRDVQIKDLYTNGRLTYKLELLGFEGWLRRLRKAEPTETMKASGITDLYEAWVFPDGSADAALCVFVTELPPGLAPQTSLKDTLSQRVSVAGYFFKLLRYESGMKSREEVGKNLTRRAPVLMGRSLTVLDEPAGAGTVWRESFIPLVVGGVGLVAFALFGLSWYFRRGDAAVRREIQNKLTNNPFADG